MSVRRQDSEDIDCSDVKKYIISYTRTTTSTRHASQIEMHRTRSLKKERDANGKRDVTGYTVRAFV